MKLQELYRQIPKIDRFLETPEMKVLIEKYGYSAAFQAVRDAEEELREKIGNLQEGAVSENTEADSRAEQLAGEIAALPLKVASVLKAVDNRRMHPVINATGIILHTNLGRAPFSREVMEQVFPLMTGYTNLEFDLESGRRGSRYDHFSDMICTLTGAEAAMAVNNNAGAVLLMLSALTKGREVIVSRGELVEIGGKFRIPEVMEQSGTRLLEAGTTNRTYAEDYENAVTENTAGFLKVHTSNYKITGFTHEASVEELAELGQKYDIPVLVDLGSGSLIDFRKYGLPGGYGAGYSGKRCRYRDFQR